MSAIPLGKSVFRKPDVWAVAFLVGVSTALWVPRSSGPIDLRFDAGVYYILGTSLAEGKGYRLLNEPGEIQAVQYPPLLPALVAVEQKLLGTGDPAVVGRWLRLTYFGLFTAYVLAAYGMARQFLAAGYAGCAALIAALNADNVFLSDLLFADLPYGLAACLLVILNRRGGTVRAELAAGLTGVAAYLLRTAGITLLAAWVGESLIRRRWKQVAWRGAVAVVPVLAWQGYIRHVESGAEYRHPAYAYQRAPYQFYNVSYASNLRLVDAFSPESGEGSAKTFVARVLRNVPLMPASLGQGVAGRQENWFAVATWLHDKFHLGEPDRLMNELVTALGCLVLLGLGKLALRGEWFIPLFVGASVAVVCLTPWPGQFPRYFAPLSPFFSVPVFLVALGCRGWVRDHLPGDWKGLGWVPLALVVALPLDAGATGLKYIFQGWSKNPKKLCFYDQAWAEYDRALEWLGRHARSGEVIATWAPHWAYLWTGHRAVMPPMVPDAAEAQRLLDSVPATYLVVDELNYMLDLDGFAAGDKYSVLLPVRNADQWEVVYCTETSGTLIYKRTGR